MQDLLYFAVYLLVAATIIGMVLAIVSVSEGLLALAFAGTALVFQQTIGE